MYTVSSQYKEDIQKPYREWDFKATFTYKNSNGEVTRELTKYDIVISTVKLESGCVPGSVFEFGANISKKFSISIKNENEEYNNSTINGGTIKPWVGLKLTGGSVEWIPLGTFYIYKVSKPLKTIKIEAADFMTKFEKKYTSELVFPTTLKSIVEEICQKTGIELAGDFNNCLYTVNDYRRANVLYSYREILKYIAVAAGGYVTITRDNKLKIATIKLSSSPYLVDPDTMRISSEYEDVKTFTGLLYRKSNDNKMFGEDTTPIIIQNNVILDSMSGADLDDLLEGLYTKYHGFSYIPCNVEMRCDPALDEGDTVSFNKTTDGTVVSFIGEYTFLLGGKYKIKSPGTSELDSDFLINKYDTENSKNTGNEGGGEAAPKVNPNLLLISKFTRATLPIPYVDVWDDPANNLDSYGLECLDTYQFQFSDGWKESFYMNRFWLPYQGDLKYGETYTLSIYIKSRLTNITPKWHFYLAPRHSAIDGIVVPGITLNNQAANQSRDGSSAANIKIGEIQLKTGWDWYNITFKVPDSLSYDDTFAYNQNILGNHGYMIIAYADQTEYSYGKTQPWNYGAHVQLAKLEEGSEATAWCPGQSELIMANEILDDFGRVRHTISAITYTNCSVYSYCRMETLPALIMYNETSQGSVAMMRQKRVEDRIDFQQIFSPLYTQGNDTGLPNAAYSVAIQTNSVDKITNINSQGGVNINGNTI